MSKSLLERFQECERDPELLSARSDVAILDARLSQLLERVSGAGASPEAWSDCRETFERIDAASKSGDLESFAASMLAMRKILKSVADEETAWQAVQELIEAKTAVAADEWKRQKDLKQFITIPQMMQVCASLLQCVTRHVSDGKILQAIRDDFRATVKMPAGASLGG